MIKNIFFLFFLIPQLSCAGAQVISKDSNGSSFTAGKVIAFKTKCYAGTSAENLTITAIDATGETFVVKNSKGDLILVADSTLLYLGLVKP